MTGHNAAIGGGGFHHVALYVRDYDASIKFYTEALGFSERLSWGEGEKRAALLDTGDGNYFEIISRPSADPMPARQVLHIALRTNDTDAAIERARAAGAVVTLEPKDIVFKSTPPLPARIAFCEGPNGEAIEFFQNDMT